jgi:hypothetical protein
MRYRCVLVIGTNKPELPGIYLEIKRSHATGLVGHCSQKCSSDWGETVATLRHIPQDPSSLAKTVVPVRWTWFAFIANTVQIRLHRVITEIHRFSSPLWRWPSERLSKRTVTISTVAEVAVGPWWEVSLWFTQHKDDIFPFSHILNTRAITGSFFPVGTRQYCTCTEGAIFVAKL